MNPLENRDNPNDPHELHSVNAYLDLSGLMCPEPIMMLHQQFKKMAGNTCVELIATDPASWRDVPKFCHFLGHLLIKKEKRSDHFYYYIRKKEAHPLD